MIKNALLQVVGVFTIYTGIPMRTLDTCMFVYLYQPNTT